MQRQLVDESLQARRGPGSAAMHPGPFLLYSALTLERGSGITLQTFRFDNQWRVIAMRLLLRVVASLLGAAAWMQAIEAGQFVSNAQACIQRAGLEACLRTPELYRSVGIQRIFNALMLLVATVVMAELFLRPVRPGSGAKMLAMGALYAFWGGFFYALMFETLTSTLP
ncbi:hypothetical protein A3F55_01280 [Candidatus Adlerbacteria bacterium RIFCSPHIGHO2_12_FULL_53_18]|uniref:Uncharacterized protein n=1 Tax=Candidatus Adlerbacteria bacterium RIFCSPHIGHO2_12_FULL_53_18 TaxID=1797242 RepID=A0A1F4XTH2_9BACT|nr:MAG: hypothetical protein A3F55_01280 [Candidatus Adlerbacteria bacterium RIFCSPHIGHO2_12_FULL_53_18]